MTSRQTLCGYHVLALVLGAVSSGLPSQAPTMEALWLILSVALPYLWFYRDAAERGFPRTSRWSASIILFSLVAVPLYLFKSRPAGQRFKAMAKATGVFALSILLPILGSAVIALISARA